MKNYNINEVAKMFNITTNKIRFYEEKGLISPKRNSQNEYRQYNVNDIMRLQSIILYRSIGMSIDNIRDMLNDSAKHNLLNHFTGPMSI